MIRPALAVARGVAWRTLHNMLRNLSLVLPAFLFPLFFFVAFTGGLSQLAGMPGFDFPHGYTAFQFCFVLLQSAAFGGVFTGFGIARDFEGGFGKRLLLAAPNRIGIVLGYWLASVARWLMVVGLLTVIALAAGMEVGGGPVDLVGVYTLGLLTCTVGFAWACGIALRFRTIQSGPLMQLPVFFVLFLAPVYVPLDLLSGWIHAAAVANPVTYVVEAARSLIGGDTAHVGVAFAAVAGAVLLASTWAVRGLRRAEASL